MHRLRYFILIVVLIFSLSAGTRVFAQAISSAELINNAKLYDGKVIIYAGEVIGDVMVRGEYAWVNVSDGKNAIGIWINKNLTKEIIHTGSYKAKGDRIEVVGILQRACLEHGGDLDIHAHVLRKLNSGRLENEQLIIGKKNLTLILFGVLCLVLILRPLKPKSKK